VVVVEVEEGRRQINFENHPQSNSLVSLLNSALEKAALGLISMSCC